MRPYHIAFLLVLLLSGCGRTAEGMVPVSGRVLVDGQPVKGLRVAFFPVGRADRQFPGPASYGVTDAEGRYTLISAKDKDRGAVAGPCQVRIESPTGGNTKKELSFEVPSTGTDAANFDISWK